MGWALTFYGSNKEEKLKPGLGFKKFHGIRAHQIDSTEKDCKKSVGFVFLQAS